MGKQTDDSDTIDIVIMEVVLHCPRLKALWWCLLRLNFSSQPGLSRGSRSLEKHGWGGVRLRGSRGHNGHILESGGGWWWCCASPEPFLSTGLVSKVSFLRFCTDHRSSTLAQTGVQSLRMRWFQMAVLSTHLWIKTRGLDLSQGKPSGSRQWTFSLGHMDSYLH